MAQIQDLGPIYRGEDVTLVFTMTPTTDITGWTISTRVKQTATDPTSLVSASATITNAAAGIFTVALSAAQTNLLPAGQLPYDVWRTDSGSAAALSVGMLVVRGSVRIP